MALNAEVSFTWIGHGTWKVRSAKGKTIYIDPFVMNNPVAPEALKKVDVCDLMLITHGHFDHVHDALEIAKATKPKIVTNYEIGAWLGSKGVDAGTADDAHDDSCAAWARRRPGPTLLVATEPAIGIGPEHVGALLEWARATAPGRPS